METGLTARNPVHVVPQTRLLNTHTRYLYAPLVELAERLIVTMPPETGLDAAMQTPMLLVAE